MGCAVSINNKGELRCDHTAIKRHLLRGNMDIRYAKDNRIVRIFLSSTFSDYKFERDELFARVYPFLQEHCQEKGYEFQVVDMRWGVRDEATIDHKTTDLCLKELSDCKDLSVGPYFVTLLSHRYGYRPLERTIVKNDFEKLASKTTAENLKLLKKWYKLDMNAVPEAYVLQPITLHIPDYAIRATEDKNKKAKYEWYRESGLLKEILYTAAKEALPSEAHRYEMSVTEMEIEDGLFGTDSRPRDCFVFYRNIQDVDGSNLSKKYTDEESKGDCFTPANKQLAKLKAKLENEVAINAIYDNKKSYSLAWEDIRQSTESKIQTGGMEKYLNSFCSDFAKSIKSAIDQATESVDTVLLHDEIYKEALQHINFCKERCETFYGRERMMKIIEDEITTAKPLPYVIYGKSGAGKTSLTAQIGKNINRWLNGKVVVIMRFIGTTVDSSAIRGLLISVIRQVRQAYNQGDPAVSSSDLKEDAETKSENKSVNDSKDAVQNESVDSDDESYDSDDEKIDYDARMSTLEKGFCEALQIATAEEPLVLILDSLDQLSTKENPQMLRWLPDSLPSNVHLVLSTLPDTDGHHYGYLSKLREKFEKKDPNRFLHVESLDEEDTILVINGVLEANKRKLTPDQVRVVTSAFSNHKTPLFLKICCEEALKWTSFQQVSTNSLQTTVAAAIKHMLSELEEKHGQVLVRRTFAYVTISRYGLSESELQSILSCDEEVLSAVYQYWTPPIRILPPLLFVRLKRDVQQYLVERGADGTKVITWYHNQFKQTIQDLLLSKQEEETKFHAMIARYFMEETKLSEKIIYLTPQPFKIGNNWNMRKLNELPFHLARAAMFREYTDYIVMNFAWHMAKIQASSVRLLILDVVSGMESLSERHDCSQWNQMLAALRLSENVLSDKKNLDLLPSQILGRMSKGFESYRNQCVQHEGQKLLPMTKCLTGPGNELKRCILNHYDTEDLCLTADGEILFVACADDELHIMNLKTWSDDQVKLEGIPIRLLLCCSETYCVALVYNCEMEGSDTIQICHIKQQSVLSTLTSDGYMDVCSVIKGNTHIVALTEDSINLFDVRTGKEVAHTLMKDGHRISGACNILCVMKVSTVEIYNVSVGRNQGFSHSLTIPVDMNGEHMISISCSPSAEHVMLSQNKRAVLYSASTGKRKHEFVCNSGAWKSDSFVTDNIYMTRNSGSIDIIYLDSKEIESVFTHQAPIMEAAASQNTNVFATSTPDHSIRIWEPKVKLGESPVQSGKKRNQTLLENIKEIRVLPETTRYILIHTHVQRPVASKLYIYDIQQRVVVRKMQFLIMLKGLTFASETTLLACSDRKQLIVINVDNITIEKQYPTCLGSCCFFVLPGTKEVIGLSEDKKGLVILNMNNSSSSSINILPSEHKAELDKKFMIDNEACVGVVHVIDGALKVIDICNKRIRYELTLKEKMPVSKYHITNDKKYLAVLCGQERKYILDVWNLNQASKMHSFTLGYPLSFQFLEHNDFFFYVGLYDRVFVYNLVSGESRDARCLITKEMLFPKQIPSNNKPRHCFLVNFDRFLLCDITTLKDVARFLCNNQENIWRNKTMIDDWTIVATQTEYWNENADNICILQFYDGPHTKREQPQIFHGEKVRVGITANKMPQKKQKKR